MEDERIVAELQQLRFDQGHQFSDLATRLDNANRLLASLYNMVGCVTFCIAAGAVLTLIGFVLSLGGCLSALSGLVR